MKIAGPRVIARFGFRHVILINGVISAATIAMCAFFVPGTPLAVVFLLLLVAGFFQSLQFTATQALGYADVSQRQMSTATSIASMAQQLSRGFGISIVALLLHLSLTWRGAAALDHSDFIVAFSGATLMALSCLAFSWSLPHDAAVEVSGHQPKIRA